MAADTPEQRVSLDEALSLLDTDALAKLGARKLRPRRVVGGALTGLHRAVHHGVSIEFAEHKEYSPGDDIRHIDWRALARLDKDYVKKFENETELTAYLLLDGSGSMGYAGSGRPTKLRYASSVAALIAALLVRQRDQVGLVATSDDKIDVFVPARARTAHLPEVVRVLATLKANGSTNLSKAVDQIARTARRSSLVFVLSDLLDGGPEMRAPLLQLAALGHDVTVLHVLDDDELDFPFDGLTLFEGIEDRRELLVEPRTLRTHYLRELASYLAELKRTFSERRVEYRLLRSSVPPHLAVAELVDARDGRKRSGLETDLHARSEEGLDS